MKFAVRPLLLVLAVLLLTPLAAAPAAPDRMATGFAQPPPDCRPEVFWDWMGGMISREGITKDLEALAAQGVGGVMIMQMPDQAPHPRVWSFRDYPGKVKCLSEEYFAVLHHAVAETDRLGLNMSIFFCPGWSHAGGPWVPPEKGLKKLSASTLAVTGPMRFSDLLAKPPLLVPRIGGTQVPDWNKDAALKPQLRENFYRDVAVLAVPDHGPGKVARAEDVVDLTSRMDAEGRLNWEVPTGKWTVSRVALMSDNGINHPAPMEAVGLECDRMDPAAVRLVFDGLVGRVHREAKAKGYRSFKRFETDSYEGGSQDFGVDFIEQFRRRRGYDCTRWLPTWLDRRLNLGNLFLTVRFRADMVRTISELWAERFHGTLRRLADEHGLEWMNEPYFGTVLDWRTIGGVTTMPGAEFWVDKEGMLGSAPEIGAIYGQKIIWAEAFTAESYNSAWRNDPWKLKSQGDVAFSRGINHFFMHGFAHNPFPDDYQPGVTMGYWGTQFNRHATWWPYSRSWHEYLARCQFMLRQGLPVNDVLVYPPQIVPTPHPMEGPFRQVVLTDEVLMRDLAVRDGRLVLPHGTEFAALALNPNQPLRPETLGKIRTLVEAGATLIGNAPPPRSASLENFPACDREIVKAISEMWGATPGSQPADRKLGRGRIIAGLELPAAYEKVIGLPDVVWETAGQTPPPVRSAHRRVDGAEVYFVCHQGDQELLVQASFRAAALQPEWWDPVHGSHRDLPEFRFEQDRTVVPLRLAPRQSGFVVFQRKTPTPDNARQTAGGNFPTTRSVVELAGPWNLSFNPRWGGPANVTFEKLADWSTHSASGIKYYSGTATYRKSFDIATRDLLHSAIRLDLGVVKNLARVRLNGRDLGMVWCAPWQVEIPTGLLQEKTNALEIVVVNTWVNRLIGDEQEPEDCELEPGNLTGDRKGSYDKEVAARGLKDLPDWFVNRQPRPSAGRFTFTIWRYYDQAAPLQPSGLLGPVKLMATEPRERK